MRLVVSERSSQPPRTTVRKMRLTQDLDNLHPDTMPFLEEFHVGLLSTTRPDGTLHVVGVGFTYDPQTRLAWSIGDAKA